MAETKKYLVTDGPLGADRIYLNGEEIELDARSAKRLLTEKKIATIKVAALKGGDDAGDQKGDLEDAGQKDNKEEGLKDKTKGSTKGGKK
jgi:hypothetical protein